MLNYSLFVPLSSTGISLAFKSQSRDFIDCTYCSAYAFPNICSLLGTVMIFVTQISFVSEMIIDRSIKQFHSSASSRYLSIADVGYAPL